MDEGEEVNCCGFEGAGSPQPRELNSERAISSDQMRGWLLGKELKTGPFSQPALGSQGAGPQNVECMDLGSSLDSSPS